MFIGKLESGGWVEYQNDWNTNDRFTAKVVAIEKDIVVVKDMRGRYIECSRSEFTDKTG